MHDNPPLPHSPEPVGSDDLPRELVDEITSRLREVCAHLPPDDFADLVEEIARAKIRTARRAASLPGLSGLWDPPVSEVLKAVALPEPPPAEPTSSASARPMT